MKIKTKETQCQRLLYALKKGHLVSRLSAMYDLGIANLPARINNLRKQGYEIETVKVQISNKYGQKTSYAKYRLKDDTEQALNVLFAEKKQPKTLIQKILNFFK